MKYLKVMNRFYRSLENVHIGLRIIIIIIITSYNVKDQHTVAFKLGAGITFWCDSQRFILLSNVIDTNCMGT